MVAYDTLNLHIMYRFNLVLKKKYGYLTVLYILEIFCHEQKYVVFLDV